MFIHRRKQPAPLPPTATPLDAVLVALDSARRTGYATYVRGRLWDYGEVDARKLTNRARVLAEAIQAGYMRGVPVAVVIEVPWGGYQSTVLSLHATATLWREAWLTTGQSAERCVERTAGDWRRRLFGASNMPREQARRLEAALARQVVERDYSVERRSARIGPDAAAAICIGQTIIRAREIAAVIGCGCVRASKRGLSNG